MKRLVSIVFLTTCTSLWSQSQYVPNLFSKDSLRFFISSNNLQLFFNNSVVTKNGDQYLKTPLYIDQKETFYTELNLNNFEFIRGDQKDYFIRRNLGEVFIFENDSLKRIDRSSNLLSNSGSGKVIYKNEIYSFFGYGFFDNSNLTVAFDLNTKEWNKISHPLDSEIPQARRNFFFSLIDDQLYFFNGSNKSKRLNDFFIFNFNKKTYKKIGEVVDEFPYSNSNYLNSVTILDFKKIYQYNELLLMVDFKNLSFSVQDNLNSLDLRLSEGFLRGDKVFFLKTIDQNEFYIEDININYLEAGFKVYQPIIKVDFLSDENLTLLLIVIFVLSTILVLVKLIRLRILKNSKVLKQANYLTLKNELIILTRSESELLSHLILNPLSSMSNLYSISFFDEYTDFYKKQIISKTLEELAKKINDSVEISSLVSIEKKTNKHDKRAIDIMLKGDIFIYKGWLNYLFTV